jgi:hypothetical protein
MPSAALGDVLQILDLLGLVDPEENFFVRLVCRRFLKCSNITNDRVRRLEQSLPHGK